MTPEGWQQQVLGESIKLISGQHVAAALCNDIGRGVPYLTGPSDFPNGRIEVTRYVEQPKVLCEPGDVLLTVKGSGAGKSVVADRRYAIGRQLMALRPVRINGKYLALIVNYHEADLGDASSGVIPGISRDDILEFPILTPPEREQTMIAQVLETWDRTIQKTGQLIAAKRERKRGLMQVLLTGKKRFEEFEDTTWKVTEIQDVADINPSRNQRREDFKGEFVEMAGVSEEGRLITVNQVDPSLPPSGYSNFVNWDTLVAKITPCFENGKGALIEGLKGLALGSTEFHVLSPKPTIRPKFLYYLTRTHDFRQRGIATMQGSGGQRRVPADFIRRLKVKMPSLEEQDRIVDVLSTADAEIENLEKQLEAYKLQKRGLMQQLLTGKKRVKVENSEVIPA